MNTERLVRILAGSFVLLALAPLESILRRLGVRTAAQCALSTRA